MLRRMQQKAVPKTRRPEGSVLCQFRILLVLPYLLGLPVQARSRGPRPRFDEISPCPPFPRNAGPLKATTTALARELPCPATRSGTYSHRASISKTANLL